jgi:cyclopropane fatty-acyl-phospholipid synthase-like methyltransferase
MQNIWESTFSSKEPIWGFLPSDSAHEALETFSSAGIKKLLIPGIGYGRNARLFLENGFEVTGIEISGSAIETAKANGIDCTIHHGSVTSMPFDAELYDAIFCYAVIHFLNRKERRTFMEACFSQLKSGGLMILGVTSSGNSMFGSGKYLSRNRYLFPNGLKVFFYDVEAIEKEFTPFGLLEYRAIDEPVKFETGHDPVKLYYVVCRKR